MQSLHRDLTACAINSLTKPSGGGKEKREVLGRQLILKLCGTAKIKKQERIKKCTVVWESPGRRACNSVVRSQLRAEAGN